MQIQKIGVQMLSRSNQAPKNNNRQVSFQETGQGVAVELMKNFTSTPTNIFESVQKESLLVIMKAFEAAGYVIEGVGNTALNSGKFVKGQWIDEKLNIPKFVRINNNNKVVATIYMNKDKSYSFYLEPIKK